MCACVVRNVKENDLCRGIECRFSDEYIGEKVNVVGYCLWCDGDKMRKVMGNGLLRSRHVEKGLQFFYENDDDVFRMALTRLPVEYRTYWHWKIRTPIGIESSSAPATTSASRSSRIRDRSRSQRSVSQCS